ncbi:hypothetical protein H6P81_002625 [Aristolochia fimbriata]|uniref:MULE transposase domain-containing protein n=1 Tax=Aristolochia fimbriata TaxID=158543 RepID=A0AAV7FEE4_ARIFI|nr:hypothetical protein H6P81_002625 [Aristolochia fimbriata]
MDSLCCLVACGSVISCSCLSAWCQLLLGILHLVERGCCNFGSDTFVWDIDVPNLNTFASISHERRSNDIDVNEEALGRKNEQNSPVINIDINENDEVETERYILIACGVNGEGGIITLAYAIVDVKSEETWTWFLRILRERVVIRIILDLVIISDRQKGLLNAVPYAFLEAFHGYCRHMCTNFYDKFKEKDMRDLFG